MLTDDPSKTGQTRRELLARMGTGLVAITVNSACGPISPAQSRAMSQALRSLTDAEGRTLEALGDTVLPGSAAAGIAHYVDDQLSSATPLLMLKYLDYPGPFLDFYQQGLRSLDRLGGSRFGSPYHQLRSTQRLELVRDISRTNPPDWSGPPAPLFYFATRSDAVDVYYGTEEGFARLEVPYLAHIAPPRKW